MCLNMLEYWCFSIVSYTLLKINYAMKNIQLLQVQKNKLEKNIQSENLRQQI